MKQIILVVIVIALSNLGLIARVNKPADSISMEKLLTPLVFVSDEDTSLFYVHINGASIRDSIRLPGYKVFLKLIRGRLFHEGNISFDRDPWLYGRFNSQPFTDVINVL